MGLEAPDIETAPVVELYEPDAGGCAARPAQPRLTVLRCHCIDVVVGVLVANPIRIARVRFEHESGSLQYSGRCDVVGMQHARDAGERVGVEQPVENQVHGFGRVALAPMLGSEVVADLRTPRCPREVQRNVTEDDGVGRVGDGCHPPLTICGSVHPDRTRDLAPGLFVGERQWPALQVGDIRVVAPGHERLEIGLSYAANQQPLRAEVGEHGV